MSMDFKLPVLVFYNTAAITRVYPYVSVDSVLIRNTVVCIRNIVSGILNT